MKQILKLVFLLVIGQTAFAQAPSNYTNINGRYRWIAGMFDSTFHIPKGSTPSLRTGGSTNSGGLFYNTSDSSVYTYTGTQWIKLRGSINPSDTTNKYVTQVYKKSGSDSIFYVKGGVHTWAFNDSTGSPGGGGGGKVYYFNGGVSMGTFGGFTMYELGDTANTGAAANFTRATTGNIANFITDPNKPGLLQIPAGVWTVDAWLSETGGGANHAEIWVEVEKWDGSTITTIATSPIEQITEGGTPNLYSWSVSIPTTSLTVTDRIIIQFYISNTNGKTVTLYTQNGYVGEVHTTFTTGIGAINGLSAPAQYLVTGTSGTDFNINSATATHTFNLPTASATNRGALSTTDWSTFNNKVGGSGTTNYMAKFTGSTSIGNSMITEGAANEVALEGNGTTGGSLNLKHYASFSGKGVGYSWIGVSSNNYWFQSQTASGTKSFYFDITNNTLNSVRQYIMPNASGTLALTSDITSAISGTTNYIPKFTSSSAIGNSTLQTDASGNLGLGVTPSAWTITPTLQVRRASMYNDNGDGSYYTTNAYYDGSWKYIGTGTATQYYQLTGQHVWRTAPSGIANNAITFTQSMTLDASGNLGLGTSSPNALTGYTVLTINGNTTGSVLDLDVSDARTGTFVASSSQLNIGSITNIPFIFVTNNTERMRITSTGILTVGNSTTRTVLNGALGTFTSLANVNTTSGQAGITVGVNDGTNNRRAALFVDQDNAVWGLTSNVSSGAIPFVLINGGAERMRITSGGNVGIGTSSPTSISNYIALTINGTSGSFTEYQENGGRAFRVGSDATTGGFISQTSADPIRIFTSSTERMRITSGGNVGIGTTSPNYTLQVDNQSASTTRLQITNSTTGNGSADGIQILNIGADAYFSNRENGLLAFETNSSERMRITSDGSVGIGSTSLTGYNLRVEKNLTGSTTSTGIASFGQIQSDATANARYFSSQSSQAAGFTTTNIQHYHATQGTLSGTVTNQIAFNVANTLTGGVSNFAFKSDLDAGTNRWNLYMNGTANNYLAGSLGIGTTSLTGYGLRVLKSITGATTSLGIVSDGAIQADVTNTAAYFRSVASASATPFALTDLAHFQATTGSLGSASITSQYGFLVASSMTGASNNFAFYGNLAAATGRWNLYMNGTADNYLAGKLAIGTTSPSASALLDVSSTTQGFLPPRMTGAQAEAIATPAAGLMIYANNGNGTTITSTGWWGYDGTTWVKLN